MSHQIKACIFDFDGLLVDSERCYTEATNEVLAKYGKELTWDIKAHLMGRPTHDAASYLINELQLPLKPDDLIEATQSRLDQLFREVQPLPGALRLLDHLHSCNIPIAIGTGSKDRNFQTKTGHLPHLVKYFKPENIVTSDSPELKPGRGKPNPDIFEIAARTLNLDIDGEDGEQVRSQILVFEDSTGGCTAALAGKMKVLWVPDEGLKKSLGPEQEAKVGAHQTLSTLEHFDPEMWGLPPFKVN